MNRAPMSVHGYQWSWLAVDTVAAGTLAPVVIPETVATRRSRRRRWRTAASSGWVQILIGAGGRNGASTRAPGGDAEPPPTIQGTGSPTQ